MLLLLAGCLTVRRLFSAVPANDASAGLVPPNATASVLAPGSVMDTSTSPLFNRKPPLVRNA